MHNRLYTIDMVSCFPYRKHASIIPDKSEKGESLANKKQKKYRTFTLKQHVLLKNHNWSNTESRNIKTFFNFFVGPYIAKEIIKDI